MRKKFSFGKRGCLGLENRRGQFGFYIRFLAFDSYVSISYGRVLK